MAAMSTRLLSCLLLLLALAACGGQQQAGANTTVPQTLGSSAADRTRRVPRSARFRCVRF